VKGDVDLGSWEHVNCVHKTNVCLCLLAKCPCIATDENNIIL
jgi:hypothetical protein